MNNLVLKPNRTVFVTFQRIIGITVSIFFAALFIIIGTIILEGARWLGLIMIGVGVVILLSIPWIIYSTKVRYEKANYRFEKTRIITTRGGVFSDSSTELEIRNVTHVKLVLPWIENKLFGTGAVHVESAGTGGVEAHLLYLDEPERIYSVVQELMKANGFSLKSEKNLMETRASPTGAIVDVLTGLVTAFFAFVWVGGLVLIPLVLFAPWLLLVMMPVFAIVALGFYAYYRNAVSKTYTITEDGVYYDEGFLTRRRAVIPVENLSNSEVKEPLIKRIFGISDVIVSCQGSGAQIKFSNLADAKSFDTSISTLIDTEHTAPSTEEPEHRGEVRAAARKRVERTKRSAQIETTTYKPSIRPSLIAAGFTGGIVCILIIASVVIALTFSVLGSMPLVSIIALIIFLSGGGLIIQAIMNAVTNYTVEQNRVKSSVDFFNRNEHSFSDDRLTRITLKRTVFDRIAKTVSIDFWSIGSGARITFRSVEEKSGIVDMLAHKYGLREPTEHLIRSEPKTSTILRANTYGIITALILLASGALLSILWAPAIWIALGITAIPAVFIVIGQQLAYRNAFFAIDEKNLYETHGWFTREQSFVNVEDIKGVTTTQYPLGTQGSIAFNVAGEGVIKTDKGESIVPNVITAPYVLDAFSRSHDLSISLDEFAPPTEPVATAHLSTPRVAIPVLLIGIIVPLLPIALIAAIITGIRASRTRFLIEENRIVREVRFIYPTRKVIFYDRIDHLNTSQGFFDKIFKTGVVEVTTTGSSRIEMTVGPTKDHLSVHRSLDDAYR